MAVCCVQRPPSLLQCGSTYSLRTQKASVFPKQDFSCLFGKQSVTLQPSLILRPYTSDPEAQCNYIEVKRKTSWLRKPSFYSGSLTNTLNVTKLLTNIHQKPTSHWMPWKGQGCHLWPWTYQDHSLRFHFAVVLVAILRCEDDFSGFSAFGPCLFIEWGNLLATFFVQHSIAFFVKFLQSFLMQRK
jgi:hypothetical protein